MGKEGKVVASEGGDVGKANEEVVSDESNNTKYKEESNRIITVKPRKHVLAKVMFSVNKSVSRGKTCWQQHSGKCCPKVFTTIRFDDFVGNDKVYDDHEKDEEGDESL